MLVNEAQIVSNASSVQIEGGHSLKGIIAVQGSKNAVLPMIAAAIVVEKGQTVIRNVPAISDVDTSIEILNHLGVKTAYLREEGILVIDASNVNDEYIIPDEFSTRMRASILFLAPVLLRKRRVQLGSIGGCALGTRATDFHYRGFIRLGAKSTPDNSNYFERSTRLKGSDLYLDVPSHTGTENLMLAAALAEGTTVIENAASDPEVVDFALFLNSMGARISGAGTRRVVIEGVENLAATAHTVMSDRLEAGSLMIAAAITQGDISLVGANVDHLRIFEAKLRQIGCSIEQDGHIMHIKGPEKISPINVITDPYPGFPTDLQPCITALVTLGQGTSYVRERIFSDRFDHAEEMTKMGAQFEIKDDLLIIHGVSELKGNTVRANNIRSGQGLILAALAAKGTTIIENINPVLRGWAKFDAKLNHLGGKVKLF